MIVRSKQPLKYHEVDRKKSGYIKPELEDIVVNLNGTFTANIIDKLRIERVNPEPGSPLYSYVFIRRRPKLLSDEMVSQLFDAVGQQISPGDTDFAAKFRECFFPALVQISNTTEIYDSGLDAFEVIDETLEIVPVVA